MAKHLFLPKPHPLFRFSRRNRLDLPRRILRCRPSPSPGPPRVLRSMQKYRDRTHDYGKFHLTDLTQGALNTYEGFVDTVLVDSDFRFFCCVAARDPADPVAPFADPWTAYLKLFEQLFRGAIRPGEITTVLADNYSTPDHGLLEEDLKSNVNRRLRRLGIASVVRLDSRATGGLQAVDVLTSAIAFHHRLIAELAGSRSPKALLADHVAQRCGVPDFLTERKTACLGLRMYDHASRPGIAGPDVGE